MTKFYGKTFKRVRSENIDELLEAARVGEFDRKVLQKKTPTFRFTKLDEEMVNFSLDHEGKVISHNFKLEEASEMKRRDGSTVSVIYTMESDNVLTETITPADGPKYYFKREFGDKEAKLTITIEGIDIEGVVYYEVAQ